MMKIVRSMSRLGLVLIVLTSTAAASAEGDLYWAVSHGCEDVREADGYALFPLCRTYGAAWGFASLEEAEAAAVAECRKQGRGCGIPYSGKNSCFGVLKLIRRHVYIGTHTVFSSHEYASRAEATAELGRVSRDAHGTAEVVGVELAECPGAE